MRICRSVKIIKKFCCLSLSFSRIMAYVFSSACPEARTQENAETLSFQSKLVRDYELKSTFSSVTYRLGMTSCLINLSCIWKIEASLLLICCRFGPRRGGR